MDYIAKMLNMSMSSNNFSNGISQTGMLYDIKPRLTHTLLVLVRGMTLSGTTAYQTNIIYDVNVTLIIITGYTNKMFYIIIFENVVLHICTQNVVKNIYCTW